MKDAPVENKPEIALTYVIVSKRVNSRFFKIDKGGYTNPPSGSVFDDVVTLPERYDFYLISQSVRQGTVNPTSYNVIEDNSMWPPKNIQMLTYKLTHLYYNWPGTVIQFCLFAFPFTNIDFFFYIGSSSDGLPVCAQIGLLGGTEHS